MRSIDRRLRALERAAPRPSQAGILFPGWDIVAGAVSLGDWLAEHSFKSPIHVLLAGVRGPWLEIVALEYWLELHGFTNAADAFANGGLRLVPPALEMELRMQALCCYSQEVSELILDNLDKDIGPFFDAWHALQAHLKQTPIPVPDDTQLANAQQLEASLRQGIGKVV